MGHKKLEEGVALYFLQLFLAEELISKYHPKKPNSPQKLRQFLQLFNDRENFYFTIIIVYCTSFEVCLITISKLALI